MMMEELVIATHMIKHEVNIHVVIGFYDVEKLDNVRMIVQLLQVHDLSESSLGIGRILQ